MRLIFFTFTLVLFPAFGSDNVSGSRLKTLQGTTPDGAKAFVGWYDTELKIRCNFSTPNDPAFRSKFLCLPPAFVIFDGGAYYSDSNCTKPRYLVERSAASGLPASARLETQEWGYFPSHAKIFRLKSIPKAWVTYRLINVVGGPNKCVDVGVVFNDRYVEAFMEDKLSLDKLVEMTVDF